MSELGDLLEVICCAHEQVTTLVAEYREWGHRKPTRKLLVDYADTGEGRLRWRGAGPWPQEIARTRRIWYSPPGRLRVELSRNNTLERLGVRDRVNWWRWDHVEGATAGNADLVAGALLFPPLLDPSLLTPVRLISTLHLESVGAHRRADREVLTARGRPRQAPSTRGILSYDLEFDAQHGTMLRHAAYEDGRLFQLTEALWIRYGSEINSDRFVFDRMEAFPQKPQMEATSEAGPNGVQQGTPRTSVRSGQRLASARVAQQGPASAPAVRV
jgi:hypothetical protein